MTSDVDRLFAYGKNGTDVSHARSRQRLLNDPQITQIKKQNTEGIK